MGSQLTRNQCCSAKASTNGSNEVNGEVIYLENNAQVVDEIDGFKKEAEKIEKKLDALESCDFEEINELVTPRTFMKIESNSLEKSFVVSHSLKSLSRTKGTYEHQLRQLGEDVEAFSFHLLDPLKTHAERQKVFIKKIDDLVDTAIEKNQKKFLAHPVVFDLIDKKWYGSYRDFKSIKGWAWCKWIFLTLLAPLDLLLFPIPYLVFLVFGMYHHFKLKERVRHKIDAAKDDAEKCTCVFESYKKYFLTPYFVFVRDTISYIVLLLLHCALCLSTSTISFSGIEFAIIVFFVGRIMMELDQFFKDRKKNSSLWKDITLYFRDTWNVLDFVSVLIFFVVFALRLDTLSSASVYQNHVLTAANYLYGLNTMCLTVRVFGSVLESKRSIGVMQIALLQIIGQIVIIFWQFLVVILAFSFAITKIFMTEWSYVESEEEANAQLIACKNGGIACWWSTLRHLAWSLFGLAEMSNFESSDSKSLNVMWVVYAIYLVVGVILLVNLMIALLSNVYQGVENNSLAEWCFKRCVAYRTYRSYHPIPVPLNIVSIPSMVLYRLVQKCFCNDKHQDRDSLNRYSSNQHSRKEEFEDLVPWTEDHHGKEIKTMKELMKWLEATYLSKYGSSFPVRESMDRVEDSVNRIHHKSVENQRMINLIMHQMFSDEESFDAQLWTGHPGIKIEGNTLTYEDEADVCNVRYKKPLTLGSPMFQVLIEESGKLRLLGVGIVLSDHQYINVQPGWHYKSVGYHIDDGRIYEENHRTFGQELPDALGYSGDLVGCKVLFQEEENGSVPVVFSLNRREVGRTKIKYNGKDLYPCIGMHSAGIKVKFSMGTFDQSILKGVKREIQDLKSQIKSMDRVKNSANRIHHESVENQRMINLITHQMFSDKESFDAQLWTGHPGIKIEGNTLTYEDEADACNVRYEKPLTRGSPMFQVLIEESGKFRLLGVGVVLSEHQYYKVQPGWRDKSVGYHIDDGRIYEENHRTFGRELPDALGYSGDLVGCKVLFQEEENGSVPVIFSLNRREVGRTKIKYNGKDLYPCIGMHSAGIKVKFSMGTFDQSIFKGVKGEIQGVKGEVHDLKSQIESQDVKGQIHDLKSQIDGMKEEIHDLKSQSGEIKDMLMEIKGAMQGSSK